jgi:Peptidase A4 family
MSLPRRVLTLAGASCAVAAPGVPAAALAQRDGAGEPVPAYATERSDAGPASTTQQRARRFATLSTNWAGYVITGTSRASVRFKSVSAHWVQPAVNCTGGQGDSGFWVGLGGYRQRSRALEQVGTEADCSSSGGADDFAWFELVPKSPVTLRLKVRPGDGIAASVTVKGRSVRLALRDLTTGARFLTTQRTSVIDVASAEWIAEAPSACNGGGSCRVLPLADFGSVAFSQAHATSTHGLAGPIGASEWSATALELLDLGSRLGPARRLGSSGAVATAAPTSLTSAGSAFTVTAQQASVPTRSPVPAGPFGG